MRESSHRPLIFGTPFLSTVGAIFDFPNQRISFNKVNKGMFFPMCSTKNSFVDMVQEEKATLKPPQEGETEETIKEDPIPKPKQLAKQARRPKSAGTNSRDCSAAESIYTRPWGLESAFTFTQRESPIEIEIVRREEKGRESVNGGRAVTTGGRTEMADLTPSKKGGGKESGKQLPKTPEPPPKV
ncbi:unnamed protein product [Microthlaspi erraticum]|uniref:Uncharacterized protein n=1 Tax=Microthlaspi erraticum TaxID=1685480 RepID=A0A6D2KB91_9BRAS|nr:unnamed protein product [Microthlaspi erraticum]